MGSATIELSTTATSTWLSVSIARSHTRRLAITAKHTATMAATFGPPLAQAIAANNTITLHHGRSKSASRDGVRTWITNQSLTEAVPPMTGTPLRRCRLAQSAAWLTQRSTSSHLQTGNRLIPNAADNAPTTAASPPPVAICRSGRFRITAGHSVMRRVRLETRRSPVEIRSRAMAAKTMAMPAENALPTFTF